MLLFKLIKKNVFLEMKLILTHFDYIESCSWIEANKLSFGSTKFAHFEWFFLNVNKMWNYLIFTFILINFREYNRKKHLLKAFSINKWWMWLANENSFTSNLL